MSLCLLQSPRCGTKLQNVAINPDSSELFCARKASCLQLSSLAFTNIGGPKDKKCLISCTRQCAPGTRDGSNSVNERLRSRTDHVGTFRRGVPADRNSIGYTYPRLCNKAAHAAIESR